MNCDDVRRLAAACREAQEDLFFVSGVLPPYETIAAAFMVQEEPTLMVVSGMFSVPDRLLKNDITPLFSRHRSAPLRVCVLADGVIAADIRLLADAEFRAFCEQRKISHLIVPFAELADGNEYGSRDSYGWIGEWRASLPCALRVTAVFSEPLSDYGPFIARFASPGCTVVNAYRAPDVFAYQTVGIRKKYAYTRELALRRFAHRSAVFFTDRREAEEFLRFLHHADVRAVYVNGNMTEEQLYDALDAFSSCDDLLIATKSVLASCLFYRADNVFFCGIPYSVSFLTRCASFSNDGSISCVFCEKDIEVDINILKCFAGNRREEEREPFLSEALNKLLAVKHLLIET
ncbi:MAG: hypothetical protein IJK89_03145 [Clostridia bacterium]|nr:hypothetical protein [Clostridia bacterium]